MECQSDKKLSARDTAILHEIFNPSLPYPDNQNDEETAEQESKGDAEVEDESVKEAKKLEIEAVELAEKGDTKGALEIFSKAIEVAPSWASGYNNRAQAHRLLGDVEGALRDLNKALELSEGKGKAACQAYTQRALIRRLKGEDEDALADFKSAAALGSEFAKAQVIALNPYAALCNAMMAEMIHKERTGQEA